VQVKWEELVPAGGSAQWPLCYLGYGKWTGRTSIWMGNEETHRLVGLRQNIELYGTMGRGPLLSMSSASASFFPSAWLSRSMLPPTRTQDLQVRVCIHKARITLVSPSSNTMHSEASHYVPTQGRLSTQLHQAEHDGDLEVEGCLPWRPWHHTAGVPGEEAPRWAQCLPEPSEPFLCLKNL
jgi:hypothetical protein